MARYEITRIPGQGLVLASGPYGVHPWSVCYTKCRTRATRRCVLCGGPLGKSAYRPLTNGNDRMERICVECVRKAEKKSSIHGSSTAEDGNGPSGVPITECLLDILLQNGLPQ